MTARPSDTALNGGGEFDRIRRHLRPLAEGFPGARRLLDDAATVDVPAGHQLVVTTDAMVASVHFLPGDPPADIAWKLLAVNLSDLAAKGAEPLAYSLVTALPADLPEDWLAAFAAGLGEGQRRWGIHLLGGDSVTTSGPVSVTVSALGLVPSGGMITRAGARPGDAVMVSGTIGDAALGLRRALGEEFNLDDRHTATLLSRLRRPEPRLSLGRILRGRATAAVDVSDGLVADLGHIATASQLSIDIHLPRIPLSDATRAALDVQPGLLETLLTGGDDYEVAFTVPPTLIADVTARSAVAGVSVTHIGTVADGPPVVTVRGPDGSPVRLGRTGWTHF